MPNVARRIVDGLTNLMSGAGTTADKSQYAFYNFTALSQQQAEAAYRTSWLTRKIVDVPAMDMTREWREWQAENPQIEVLEATEKRLMLRQKITRALILSRLHGGGALILGVNQGQPSDELQPGSLGKDALRYVHAVSRHQLTLGDRDMDPESPFFGQPTYFQMNAMNGKQVKLHPSRVIAFVGQPVPEGAVLTQADSWFWGDPIMQIVGDAVKNADRAQGGFSALIDEASLDIIGIPDLMTNVASAEYEASFLKRIALVALGKSTHRALIHDAAETWEQRQVNWTGMPDMMMAYLQIVAGAADIPITRLLGTSPKGLQSNGDGEERDYISMVIARQDSELRPQLERLDAVLIPSSLGSTPPEVTWIFSPIAHSNPKTLTDIEYVAAQAVQLLAGTNLIPEEALAKAVQNRMIESGQWPGLEAALDDAATAAGNDPTEGISPGEADPSNVVPIRKIAVGDAAPQSLYVSRKVVNVGDLKAWAKAQGLPALQDDLHVTIVYSRQPLDWMKVDSDWNGSENGQITIPPGGVRIVEPLGDRTAVLLFTSSTLSWRRESIINAGASSDYPDYQPHISLTDQPVDLSAVEPYRGVILLGPEIFERVKANVWTATAAEE